MTRGPGELARRRVAIGGTLGHRLRDDGVELAHGPGSIGREAGRILLEMRVERRDLGVALERRTPGDRFVQHARERVHVGPAVDLVAADLFGCAVLDRAHELARLGQTRVDRAPLDESEVGQVRVPALVEQDVAGLHVPVHQTSRVGGVERRRDLRHDLDRAIRRQRPPVRDQVPEIVALDVPHRDVQDAVGLSRGVDGHDVGMLGGGRRLGLVDETLPEGLVPRKVGTQELDDDVATRRRLLGEVHRAHAALAEHRDDPVPGDLGSDPGVAHRVFVHRGAPLHAFVGLGVPA